MTIEDVLGMAMKTEVMGRKFYLGLTEKVTHPEIKQKIQSLADDEERHEKLVHELYKSTLGREPGELPEKGVPDIVKAISDMKVDDRSKLLDVLDMAIEAERLAAKFYGRGIVLTEDNKTRAIFEELEKEEDGHYNMLIAEKAAISGDLYWFSMGDSSIMEE